MIFEKVWQDQSESHYFWMFLNLTFKQLRDKDEKGLLSFFLIVYIF